MPELRTARPEDVPAVLELWSTAAENDDRPADDAGLVRALLRHDPASLIVAFVAGELVGTIIAGWDGWRANLYRLAVRPDVRRRGVARALLDAALTRLDDLGANRAAAMVLQTNADGQHL